MPVVRSRPPLATPALPSRPDEPASAGHLGVGVPDAEPATGDRRLARATDWLITLAAPVLLTAVAVHELHYNHSPSPTWLLELAIIWPLAWRRRAPVVVFGVCLLIGLGLWARDIPSLAGASLLVALYSVAAHRDVRSAVAATVALECGVVLAAVRFAPAGSIDDALLFLSGLVAAALFLGTTLRANRRYLASAEDRARRLEREQAQQAELAAAAERTRIAREMHDIVAHGLSVVITLAEGAAANAETDPGAAREAMQEAASAGRQSLSEMRNLLELLRTDGGGARDPQPSLATLEVLLDDVRRTGLAVRTARTGDPAEIGQTAQATIYRIVQEALTNVLKHADQVSTVTVALDLRPPIVRFVIEDDGRHGNEPSPSRGNGIVGMRERVEMFGGTLEAGPSATGWLVRGELDVG